MGDAEVRATAVYQLTGPGVQTVEVRSGATARASVGYAVVPGVLEVTVNGPPNDDPPPDVVVRGLSAGNRYTRPFNRSGRYRLANLRPGVYVGTGSRAGADRTQNGYTYTEKYDLANAQQKVGLSSNATERMDFTYTLVTGTLCRDGTCQAVAPGVYDLPETVRLNGRRTVDEPSSMPCPNDLKDLRAGEKCIQKKVTYAESRTTRYTPDPAVVSSGETVTATASTTRKLNKDVYYREVYTGYEGVRSGRSPKKTFEREIEYSGWKQCFGPNDPPWDWDYRQMRTRLWKPNTGWGRWQTYTHTPCR